MDFSSLSTLSRVYLDHNATTPLASFLPEQVSKWLELWGNPSSIHADGRGPKSILRETRRKIAEAFNIHPLEVVFTSGGTEGNNAILKGVFFALQNSEHLGFRKGRNKIILSAVEHPSVTKASAFLKSRGAEVEIIPVSKAGKIDLEYYEEILDDNTALVSVMLANNETGHLFPIQQMTQLAHEHGALFHTDAVQGLGKVPLDLGALGVDFATFSGHKFYALKGSGFLFIKKGSPFENLIHGGGQERGRRGGTENLLALASLGAMIDWLPEVSAQSNRIRLLRDHMEDSILARIPEVEVTGRKNDRLPNTSNMTLKGVDGESLLMNLDLNGFSVSTGAACSSGNPEPSPVLLNMGLTREEAQSSMRIGLGWSTTLEQIDSFVSQLEKTVKHLRDIGGEEQGERWA